MLSSAVRSLLFLLNSCDSLANQEFSRLKSAKHADKTQLSSAEQIPRPQPGDYPECLVLIISPKLLIVGSGWEETLSLCLINTYLIMVNYYCLIIEEQSCQSPYMKKPSGSLIAICWHLASGWAVKGRQTGRCLYCVIPALDSLACKQNTCKHTFWIEFACKGAFQKYTLRSRNWCFVR